MLTQEILRHLWPHAPQSKIDAVIDTAPDVFRAYGLTTPLRVAHFMAQISHENGGGTVARENMNYSADRLLQIFGVGHHSAAITSADAQRLAHHPEQIAERVYGLGNPKKAKELGNTRPGDGWKFRGGGDLQLTGGASYKRIGDATGFDLYGHPDLLSDAKTSFRVAAAEFQSLKCLPAADVDDCVLVTRRVNGGRNGLAERQAWLRKWKVALPQLPDQDPEPDEPQQAPRGAETQPPKSMAQSKIGNTQIAAGAGTAVTAGATIVEKVNDAASSMPSVPDFADKVNDAVEKGSQVVETARTVSDTATDAIPLGTKIIHFLADPVILGAVAIVIIGLCAFAWWERRRHLHEDGV